MIKIHGKTSQLSLLPSVGREMSTWPKCDDALQMGVKAGWLIPFVDINVWMTGKTVIL